MPASVSLTTCNIDVRAVGGGQIAVYWRMHDGVVDVPGAFLRLAVPARGVTLVAFVEAGVGTQSAEEAAL